MSPPRQECEPRRSQLEAEELIDTTEVARMVGWSTRKVQRQASLLGGVRVAGVLVFRRGTILEHLDGRYHDSIPTDAEGAR